MQPKASKGLITTNCRSPAAAVPVSCPEFHRMGTSSAQTVLQHIIGGARLRREYCAPVCNIGLAVSHDALSPNSMTPPTTTRHSSDGWERPDEALGGVSCRRRHSSETCSCSKSRSISSFCLPFSLFPSMSRSCLTPESLCFLIAHTPIFSLDLKIQNIED
jgi:hypothetical protein